MTSHGDDVRLVERMLDGDEAAFEDFSGRYVPALYRFTAARTDGDRELARDVVQTALCKVLAKLDSYRGEAALFTWLCACCRNELLMHLRRRRSRPAEMELEERVAAVAAVEMVPRRPDPEIALLRRETERRVHLALDLLPGHYARALEWKYLESLPVREIAARLGLEPKAAESLLTRARQAFRSAHESLRGRGAAVAAALDERVLDHGRAT